MATTLPRATVRVETSAIAPGSGANLVCIWSACAENADLQPRLFGTADAIFEEHGYSEGLEYAALHIATTGKAVLFQALPINTAGAVSRFNPAGNTGSSAVTVTASGGGILAEHDGVIRVVQGGTIGTDQIKLELSLDGGRTFKAIRLGTSNGFTLPNVNGTVAFAAGTLVAGDTVAQWHGTAPLPDTADFDDARAALASGQTLFRSVVNCGDLPNSSAASALVAAVNAYETANDRYVEVRASVPDRLPLATMSKSLSRTTGMPALTFAEVGASGDTITRSEGSFLSDGARVGDTFVVTGSASNNVTGVLAGVTDLVLTLGTTDLAAETTSAASITFAPTLTFAEVGATGDTLTRSRGSWLDDGFRAGSIPTVTGSASNNVTGAVTGVTATVLTFGSTDLAAEVVAVTGVTIVAGQTKSAWMAAQDAAFAGIDGEPRIDLAAGRAARISPYSGWDRRISPAWDASLREYQHDLQVAVWRKDLGPLGSDLFDADNQLVEWDERVDGPAGISARFTTYRTWANGPRGAFISLSQTRAGDGQITSLTHNMAVINEVCTVAQQATEQAIGREIGLNADGTATKSELAALAAEVNAALELAILSAGPEGPRASKCVWVPSPEDVYNVPAPVTNATITLVLNGTLFTFDTAVRVLTNGQE